MALQDDVSVIIEGLGSLAQDGGVSFDMQDGRVAVSASATPAGKRALAEVGKRARARGYEVAAFGANAITVSKR